MTRMTQKEFEELVGNSKTQNYIPNMIRRVEVHKGKRKVNSFNSSMDQEN